MSKEEWNDKQYKVGKRYRTNNIHLEGKGSTVIVHYTGGEPSKVYDNIKYPESYIRRIKEGTDYDNGKIDRIEVIDIDE